MMNPKLAKAHEDILAEFREFKISGMTPDSDARREHMERLRKLTDAKMKIVNSLGPLDD